jgi:hypothetical protein
MSYGNNSRLLYNISSSCEVITGSSSQMAILNIGPPDDKSFSMPYKSIGLE